MLSIFLTWFITGANAAAFQECTSGNIQQCCTGDISIIPSVGKIQANAFSCESYVGGCQLKTVRIQIGITAIEAAAFSNCALLAQIIIYPTSLSAVAPDAFGKACQSPSQHVYAPTAVTQLYSTTFGSCTVVSRPNVVPVCTSSFAAGCDTGHIEVSTEVTAIENSDFVNCPGLDSVIIPPTVSSIGKNAFQFAGIGTIFIPSSVTNIGAWAFEGNNVLSSISLAYGISKDLVFEEDVFGTSTTAPCGDIEGTSNIIYYPYPPLLLYTPYILLYTSIHPYTPLYTTLHPITPLYTPIYAITRHQTRLRTWKKSIRGYFGKKTSYGFFSTTSPSLKPLLMHPVHTLNLRIK